MKHIATLCIIASCCLFMSTIYSQGLNVEQGTSNTPSQTGGMAWIGNPSSQYLSIDNNEIQARNGSDDNTLYLNFYGGDIDLLGNFNTTGDLSVDGNGIFYDNSSNNTGLGIATPEARLHVFNGNATGVGSTNSLSDVLIEDDAHAYLEFQSPNFAGILFNDENNSFYASIIYEYGNEDLTFRAGNGDVKIRLDPSASNTEFDTDIVQEPASNTLYDVGNSATEDWDQMWANSFNTGSDSRLKVGIQDMAPALDRVKQLRPVTYKYREDVNPNGRQRLGLIAQEVQPLFPEAVITEDVDMNPETGEKIITKHEYLGMNYSELIPVLIKAIQEQQEQIEVQNSEIATLRSLLERK